MSDGREWPFNSADLIRIPFSFVPHGDPEPHEWLAEHPGAIRIPARCVPRQSGASGTCGPIEVDWNAALTRWTRGADSADPITDTTPCGDQGTTSSYAGPETRSVGAPLLVAAAPSRLAEKETKQVPSMPQAIMGSSGKRLTDIEMLKQARMRALLRLIRFEENGPISDDKAYHNRIGGRDPMSDADMKNYKPKEEWLKIGGHDLQRYTAAGAYQIVRDTWERVSGILGISDFTPENQDRVALFLINRLKAKSDVEGGNLPAAIAKLNHQWVALPGGSPKAPSLQSAQAKFNEFVEEELQRVKNEQSHVRN